MATETKWIILSSVAVMVLVVCCKEVYQSSACYQTCNVFHKLMCSKGVIAINSAQYVYKNTPTHCPSHRAECNQSLTELCCGVNKSADCLDTYNSDQMSRVLEQCSQNSFCQVQSQRNDKVCRSPGYYTISDASFITYSCIEESEIANFGLNKTVAGKSVYAALDQNSLKGNSDKFSCYVRTTRNQHVSLRAVDIRCQNNTPCVKLQFSSNNESVLGKFPSHSFKLLGYAMSPFWISVNFIGNDPVAFWINLNATGNITILCGTQDTYIIPTTVTSAVTNVHSGSSTPRSQKCVSSDGCQKQSNVTIGGIIGGVTVAVVVVVCIAVGILVCRKRCRNGPDVNKDEPNNSTYFVVEPATAEVPAKILPAEDEDHEYQYIHDLATDVDGKTSSAYDYISDDEIQLKVNLYMEGKSTKTGYDHIQLTKEKQKGLTGAGYGHLGCTVDEDNYDDNYLGQNGKEVHISNDYDRTLSAQKAVGSVTKSEVPPTGHAQDTEYIYDHLGCPEREREMSSSNTDYDTTSAVVQKAQFTDNCDGGENTTSAIEQQAEITDNNDADYNTLEGASESKAVSSNYDLGKPI